MENYPVRGEPMGQLIGMIIPLLLGLWFNVPAVQAQDWVVAQAAMQRETFSGFTRERTRLVLSAEASGRVLQVNADVGDVLSADQSFACLDPTFLDLEMRTNQAEIAGLQVDVRHFRKQVKRFSQLLQQHSSSESQLDDAQHNLDKTLSQLAALKIQSEILQERRRRLCVTAPHGWVVIKRHLEAGQWINAGEPVVEVGDFSRLLVPFALSSEACVEGL